MNPKLEALRVGFQTDLQTTCQDYIEKMFAVEPTAGQLIVDELGRFVGSMTWNIWTAVKDGALKGMTDEEGQAVVLDYLMSGAAEALDQIKTGKVKIVTNNDTNKHVH